MTVPLARSNLEPASSSIMHFLHGSHQALEPGFELSGRGSDYERSWGATDFYRALERHRPPGLLGHSQAVFGALDVESLSLAGGCEDHITLIEAQGPVTRHDVNWGSQISCLMGDGADIDDPAVVAAAQAYWRGEPHPDESVWEYLCQSAVVIRCISEETMLNDEVDPDDWIDGDPEGELEP